MNVIKHDAFVFMYALMDHITQCNKMLQILQVLSCAVIRYDMLYDT